MKKEELIKEGCMVPDTLQEAMRLGRQEMVEGDGETLREYIYRLLEENGRDNTYFDFYYGTLSREEQKKAETALSQEETAYLYGLTLPVKREDVYFRYEESLFSIAVTLSVSEMLFSTFYFPVLRKTVWSNYQGSFLLFSYETGKE